MSVLQILVDEEDLSFLKAFRDLVQIATEAREEQKRRVMLNMWQDDEDEEWWPQSEYVALPDTKKINPRKNTILIKLHLHQKHLLFCRVTCFKFNDLFKKFYGNFIKLAFI